LSTGGIAIEFAAISLLANSALSVNGIVVKLGSVTLSANATLLTVAAIQLAGAVQLVVVAQLMFIELFPAVDVYISGDWLLGGLGIHPDYQRPIKKKSDWTTAGIHVGSTQP